MKKFLASLTIIGASVLVAANAYAEPTIQTDKLTPTKPTIPIKKPIPVLGCPDPAVSLNLVSHNKNTAGSYNFTLQVTVRNMGKAAFQSNSNQQFVTLGESGKSSVAARFNFGNLAVGQEIKFNHQIRNYSKSTEFFVGYVASIVYGPDIRIDGNTKNDDCRMNNNKVIYSKSQIDAQLIP